MEKTQAFFISKKISEATSAENLAQILKEMGFNSSYLTLEDKILSVSVRETVLCFYNVLVS